MTPVVVTGALLPREAWLPIGQHPYGMYRAGYGATGHYYIECSCRACGDHWGKLCHHPDRLNQYLRQYSIQHAHGLVPRVR